MSTDTDAGKREILIGRDALAALLDESERLIAAACGQCVAQVDATLMERVIAAHDDAEGEFNYATNDTRENFPHLSITRACGHDVY